MIILSFYIFLINGCHTSGRRMDVPAAGKSESGGKYEEAGNNRRRYRRGRRRRADLTKVGRFARRKRERKKRSK